MVIVGHPIGVWYMSVFVRAGNQVRSLDCSKERFGFGREAGLGRAMDFVAADIRFTVRSPQQVDRIETRDGADQHRTQARDRQGLRVCLGCLSCLNLHGVGNGTFVIPLVNGCDSIVVSGLRFQPIGDPPTGVQLRPIDTFRVGAALHEVEQRRLKVAFRITIDSILGHPSFRCGFPASGRARLPGQCDFHVRDARCLQVADRRHRGSTSEADRLDAER